VTLSLFLALEKTNIFLTISLFLRSPMDLPRRAKTQNCSFPCTDRRLSLSRFFSPHYLILSCFLLRSLSPFGGLLCPLRSCCRLFFLSQFARSRFLLQRKASLSSPRSRFLLWTPPVSAPSCAPLALLFLFLTLPSTHLEQKVLSLPSKRIRCFFNSPPLPVSFHFFSHLDPQWVIHLQEGKVLSFPPHLV